MLAEALQRCAAPGGEGKALRGNFAASDMSGATASGARAQQSPHRLLPALPNCHPPQKAAKSPGRALTCPGCKASRAQTAFPGQVGVQGLHGAH